MCSSDLYIEWDDESPNLLSYESEGEPVRVLERGAGSEPDHPLPQVRRARPGQRFPRSGGGGSPRGSREAAQHSEDSPATDLSLQTFQSHWLWLQPIISGSLGSIHGFHKTYLKFRSLGTADCHAHSAQL